MGIIIYGQQNTWASYLLYGQQDRLREDGLQPPDVGRAHGRCRGRVGRARGRCRGRVGQGQHHVVLQYTYLIQFPPHQCVDLHWDMIITDGSSCLPHGCPPPLAYTIRTTNFFLLQNFFSCWLIFQYLFSAVNIFTKGFVKCSLHYYYFS